MADLDQERRECNCQVECNEDDYMTTISSTTFPEYKFKVDFDVNNQISWIDFTIKTSSTNKHVRSNVLFLQDIAHEAYGNGDNEKNYVDDQGLTTGHNLLKVNIFFQQLNVMLIEESAEYGVTLFKFVMKIIILYF